MEGCLYMCPEGSRSTNGHSRQSFYSWTSISDNQWQSVALRRKHLSMYSKGSRSTSASTSVSTSSSPQRSTCSTSFTCVGWAEESAPS